MCCGGQIRPLSAPQGARFGGGARPQARSAEDGRVGASLFFRDQPLTAVDHLGSTDVLSDEKGAEDQRRCPARMSRSISSRRGSDGSAPSFVQASAPPAAPHTAASGTAFPAASAATKAPQNASPAAVVSTTGTSHAETLVSPPL